MEAGAPIAASESTVEHAPACLGSRICPAEVPSSYLASESERELHRPADRIARGADPAHPHRSFTCRSGESGALVSAGCPAQLCKTSRRNVRSLARV